LLFRKAGLRVHGLDADPQMLAVCHWKGFADLVLHDLAEAPYPFPSASFDHAVCLGVLPFLADPEPVFSEAARVLRPGGVFVFLSLDRPVAEPRELLVPAGEAGGGEGATLLRSSDAEVRELVERHGFSAVADVPVPVYQDAARSRRMPATCYICLRKNR
jgi:SAM-dependent methyltransferase